MPVYSNVPQRSRSVQAPPTSSNSNPQNAWPVEAPSIQSSSHAPQGMPPIQTYSIPSHSNAPQRSRSVQAPPTSSHSNPQSRWPFEARPIRGSSYVPEGMPPIQECFIPSHLNIPLVAGPVQAPRIQRKPIFPQVEKPSADFTYRPLDNSADGTRLVILEPSKDQEASISCELMHVFFGQKPKYEALSYAWGDQFSRNVIYVDGQCFYVGDNLLNALKYLRGSDRRPMLWIDAICINQNDIEERNRQVQIMPHIYTRAQTVLIWLGAPMNNFLEANGNWLSATVGDYLKTGIDSASMQLSPPGLFITEWCDSEYWNRVWIIQEVVKARRLSVLFGDQSLGWDNFVSQVRLQSDDRAHVPLQLEQQRLDKYGPGSSLERLLIAYEKALCKDPRDKVYGLVGLATDTYGRLEIDYGKSLYEVWKDVVVFQYNSPEPHTNTVDFARFLLHLLGGPERVEAEEPNYNSRTKTGSDIVLDPPKPPAIKIAASFTGRIKHIGPTCTEIISSFRSLDTWTAEIRKVVDPEGLSEVYLQRDQLLEVLEVLNRPQLDIISNLDPIVSYEVSQVHGLDSFSLDYQGSGKPLPTADTKDPRLYILDNSVNPKVTARIGLAPPGAQVGDLICHLERSEKAVVVRKSQRKLEVIGTAVVAKHHNAAKESYAQNFLPHPTTQDAAKETQANNSSRTSQFAVPDPTIQEKDLVHLYVDINSLYQFVP